VLYWPAGSSVATRVCGETSLTSCSYNQGGSSPTASSLYYPTSVALNSAGNLYVADNSNNRVLMYPAAASLTGTNAIRVWGQLGSFTTRVGATSATGLLYPYAVLVDWADNVYISDSNNNRMLFYSAGNTNATAVFGQVDFAGGLNNGGAGASSPSATSLYFPTGMAMDAQGNLLVAEYRNSRVLVLPAFSATVPVAPAIRVLGQN